jgi:hypothetical protein
MVKMVRKEEEMKWLLKRIVSKRRWGSGMTA